MKRLISEFGSVFVLLLLCAYYSVVTLGEQHPVDAKAGRSLATTIISQHGPRATVLIIVRDTVQDRRFAQAVQDELKSAGAVVLETVAGKPTDVRDALERIGRGETKLNAIATHEPGSKLGPLQPDPLAKLATEFPALQGVKVHRPDSYTWPSFLTRENLLNVVNQNADIAIIAIGMTMVIITAGIDLSVGSVVAVSGVTAAVTIQGLAGGAGASSVAIVGCCLLGIGIASLSGTFNGVMVTYFRVPAFVVTLSMMMVARGVAFIVAVRYQSILAGGGTEGTPEAVHIEAHSFSWLGNGQLFGIPNPILLMIVLYAIAHVVMTRTSIGRYIYAVGGNAEAARLSGVPVYGVLILVYAICGAMAGLGGIVDASRFAGGRPNAGEHYELQVIAAVVVGGTSLAGGEGRMWGTLIGALIIAVIQNGLNVAGVQSFEQMVIFGLLILAAVLLDQLKKHRWMDSRS